jgi:hypothetical protein
LEEFRPKSNLRQPILFRRAAQRRREQPRPAFGKNAVIGPKVYGRLSGKQLQLGFVQAFMQALLQVGGGPQV